jgi:hypothetical protein
VSDIINRLSKVGPIFCGPLSTSRDFTTEQVVLDAQIEIAALRARVEVLESESIAARRLLTPDGWSYPVLTSDDVRPYAKARAATGPIGGVA